MDRGREYRAADQGGVRGGDLANIARILNMYPKKGAVAVGSDADIVIWDPEATKKISAKKQVSRIEYNVFEGYECMGAPRMVLSRGRVAWEQGDIRAKPGDGDFVARPGQCAGASGQRDLEGGDPAEGREAGGCYALEGQRWKAI